MPCCDSRVLGPGVCVCVCVCVLPGLVNRRNMTASVWWNGTLHFTSCMSSHFIAVSFWNKALRQVWLCLGVMAFVCPQYRPPTHNTHCTRVCAISLFHHLATDDGGH